MSDFDREAEREKLREKYEQDQKEREATERMSDLLLKGATMTNAHCGTCGDPIFRYEGQEFCPTCQEVVAEDGEGDAGVPADEEPDADAATDDQTSATGAGSEIPSDAAIDATGTTPEGASGATADTTPGAAADSAGTADAATESTSPDPSGADATSPEPRNDRGVADRSDPGSSVRSARSAGTSNRNDVSTPAETGVGREGGGLAEAREALSRTVTDLARKAERSDDVERARVYLAATEEAADALAAVRRADR